MERVKPNRDPKYSAREKVSCTGFGGTSDSGIIVGIQWIYHNRLEEWTWGYKIDWENQGPGYTAEFIPEGYLTGDVDTKWKTADKSTPGFNDKMLPYEGKVPESWDGTAKEYWDSVYG
ncbi:hypothetical protein A2303_00165 [Candidatus Falkowbacteria bacterium RIFOXYB2_FULL_47_14]|uniref:Uncharacterized protein n=1 Tax=Candidatus Falkowbacteria bacterium RIFOXYA2_FULL_47_19 TaxID=1797994 RepID=A0A1F5SNK8_9BACT|nr:MAG: hypothetical protein A2227_01445 [Candidatus Falkowbacteria bacterium RIFOXYA2_FULL_47_19]OGF36805.1 MAG: hypothetical protein A2468_03320 [Candidatus Falkowbacteria bacterium RIFOXYC2_FULL_46_15]OGF44069.1 MAG: hypothetical protein A2303_00165 [Candidatus Falkowbacteria bacterium RIFOXYB2_FULL_47_14]